MISDQRKGTGQKKTVLSLPKPQTLIQQRLIDTAGLLGDGKQDITFQHSILCQTSLPYRDPGDDVRVWERLNGTAHLEVLAGKAMHPGLGRLIPLGLPFGPKPRLVMAHINAEALRTMDCRATEAARHLMAAGHPAGRCGRVDTLDLHHVPPLRSARPPADGSAADRAWSADADAGFAASACRRLSEVEQSQHHRSLRRPLPRSVRPICCSRPSSMMQVRP
jgi:hypothetical protein